MSPRSLRYSGSFVTVDGTSGAPLVGVASVVLICRGLCRARVWPTHCGIASARFYSFKKKTTLPSPNLLYRVPLYKTLRHSRFVFFFAFAAVYRKRNLNNPIDPWQIVCFLQISLCSPAQRGSRAEPLREETSGYDRCACPKYPPEFGPSDWKSDIRCQFCGAYPARRVSMY